MRKARFFTIALWLSFAVALLGCCRFAKAQTSNDGSKPPKGPGKVFVHPALGGTIFGFDVDQNGTEGLLSEGIGSGDCPYATETFDQKTGKIIKVVRKGKSADCGDDDVTWGVVGSSVGLVEHYHSPTFDHPQLTFPVLNPLNGNQFTGFWLSPLKKTGEIEAVSRNQVTPMNAFQFFDFTTMLEYVYGSDVAKNEFGPVVQITSTRGIIGLNTETDMAVVMVTDGNGQLHVNQINVATGKTTSFLGIGSGQVMGLAVDSKDDMAMTTTFLDAGVEFYDLKNQTGFEETLPFIPENCNNACTGVDVEFDPVHKLFLVAQPISSQRQNSDFSTIYVYNKQGTLLETLNGFNFFTERFDVFPVHMAIHPSDRSGFVDVTNSIGVGSIQSFTY
jgi:hypothetical protein